MSKFNIVDNRRVGRGPLATATHSAAAVPRTTHEGGVGYARAAQGELFTLAVANMVGEDTFYERAQARDDRFTELVRRNAALDPVWTAELIAWLRTGANMRSASVVAAAEYAHQMSKPDSVVQVLSEAAHVGQGAFTNSSGAAPRTPGLAAHATVRAVVASALQRADEPGEFLGYWFARFGRTLPAGVRRGLADAVLRLYTNPYNVLKYDTATRPIRFGDVVDYVGVADAVRDSKSKVAAARTLGYLIDRRHGRRQDKYPVPDMFLRQQALRDVARTAPEQLLDSQALREAGMTWEDVLSLAGDKIDKARLWEAIIPSMGLMALARNLRNFDEAGISNAAAVAVCARFADPAQVAKSRMFPFRWYQAYKAAPSLRWGGALETALATSTASIPALRGRTLVLIDTSGSMGSPLSLRSTLSLAEAATVFAMSLAARQPHGDVDVYGFADRAYVHPLVRGGGILPNVRTFLGRGSVAGHGTAIAGSIRQAYDRHDRVIVFTDMQTSRTDVNAAVPQEIPLYGFNLGGYAASMVDATRPNRVELGGLTDATFRMLPLLERGRDASWPWQSAE